MINFAETLARQVWQNNDSDTLFKMGEIVKYKGYKEVKIIGVNRQDETHVEYALDGYQFLVYEDELEKIKGD